MGLNIREIIPKKDLEFSDLKGKIVCVDAFNTLYQFLSTIKQADGTSLKDAEGRITSHLSGILYRNVALISEGVKLVYVFDGKPPELKSKIHAERRKVKEAALEKYEAAKQAEDIDSMRKYSSQLVRLEPGMIEESKELLNSLGVITVDAPSEGEAEAAYLCNKDDAYAAVSQDYDSLLFGAKRLIQNLTLSRKRKTSGGSYVEVRPTMIELKDVLAELGITREKLICVGILIGTDYNPKGIPGIGQKTALKLVKEYNTPKEIFDSVKEKIEALDDADKFDWEEIYNIFINHPKKDVDFEFPKIDEEKIKKILIERHGFGEERVEKQLEKLRKVEDGKKQTGLDAWM